MIKMSFPWSTVCNLASWWSYLVLQTACMESRNEAHLPYIRVQTSSSVSAGILTSAHVRHHWSSHQSSLLANSLHNNRRNYLQACSPHLQWSAYLRSSRHQSGSSSLAGFAEILTWALSTCPTWHSLSSHIISPGQLTAYTCLSDPSPIHMILTSSMDPLYYGFACSWLIETRHWSALIGWNVL